MMSRSLMPRVLAANFLVGLFTRVSVLAKLPHWSGAGATFQYHRLGYRPAASEPAVNVNRRLVFGGHPLPDQISIGKKLGERLLYSAAMAGLFDFNGLL